MKHLEGSVPKYKVQNYVILECESYATQVKKRHWTLSKYNRIPELPQSALSSYFFDNILHIGCKGFYEIPSVAHINFEISDTCNKHEMIAFSEAITAIEGASVSDMAKNALTQWADGKLSYEDAIRIVLEYFGFPKQS